MKTKMQWCAKMQLYDAAFYLIILLLFIKPLSCSAHIKKNTNKITINLYYKQYKPDDSLRLYLSNVFSYSRSAECFFPVENPDRSLRFEIPVNESYGYFALSVKRRSGPGDMMIVIDQFWEVGDSITMKVSHRESNAGVYSNCEFTGKGAVKYTLWDKMNQIKMVQMEEPKSFVGNILAESLPEIEVTQKQKIIFLEQNRSLIGNVAYVVFKATLLTDAIGSNLYYIRSYFKEHILNENNTLRAKFGRKFKELFFPINPYNIEDLALAQSKDYIVRIQQIFELFMEIEKSKNDPDFTYQSIVDNTAGYTREAVLLSYFLTAGNNSKMTHLYKNAEKFMLSSHRISELREIAQRSSEILENYSFKDINGKEIKISDFSNKILLIDVYFWGCGGCALYYKNVLSKLEKEPFIGKDVIVLSVSYDRTIDRWKRGLKEGIYTSDKAVNVYAGAALGNKHPFISKHEIIWMPTPMLVDRKGRIVNFKTEDLKTYAGLMAEIKKLL